MEKMLIGLVGPAGSGKDTVADYLVKKHGFVKMAHADLLKRVVQQVFAFTDEQLWGPSELRNAPDKRYPRNHGRFVPLDRADDLAFGCSCCGTEDGNDQCYLTPRFALQTLGTEWGRMCSENIWTHRLLGLIQDLQTGRYYYDAKRGLVSWISVGDAVGKMNVVIPDVRFQNELDAIKAAGGKAVRVTRGLPVLVEDIDTLQDLESDMHRLEVAPLFKERTSISAAAAQHKSETELLEIPQEKFDYLFQNSGDLHFLRLQADRMMDLFKGRIMQFDRGLQDAPPFLREKCRELAAFMSELSKKYFYEDWAPYTEYRLWHALTHDGEVQGASQPVCQMEASDLEKLKALAAPVPGWFIWKDKKLYEAPYFVKRGKWLAEYAEQQQ